ncbi:hypothetical protein MSG28_003243 [Choristoneura fumiferana]|uniref:Uncharacterized protein n=1 Tax=Choristoneura fumiferana TaxID=7141 RepID=A0ACC0KDX2_CHOFU|nr:hypothetical protein MSG28_003243 [Choristoneura fumiferana]
MATSEVEIRNLSSDTVDLLRTLFKGHSEGFLRFGPGGYVLPASYAAHADALRRMPLRHDDTWIVTCPRSGTTLAQEMVWLLKNSLDYDAARRTALHDRYNFIEVFSFRHEQVQNPDLLNLNSKIMEKLARPGYKSVETAASPRFLKSHLPLSLLPPALLDTCKLIYMTRDPRDVAVSYYHLSRLMKFHDYVGDFKSFWDLFIEDAGVAGSWYASFDVGMREQAARWMRHNLAGTDLRFPNEVSLPRTTWTQELVWLVQNNLDYKKAAEISLLERYLFIELFTFMHEQLSVFEDLDLDGVMGEVMKTPGYIMAEKMPSPRFIKTHLPMSLLSPNLLDTSKVVYVARDPRDAAEAWALRYHPNMLFMFYEDMLKMRTLCEHLDFKNFKNNSSVNFETMNHPLINEGSEAFVRQGTTLIQEMVWLLKNNLDFEAARSIPLLERFTFLEIEFFVQEQLENPSPPDYQTAETAASPRFFKSHLPLSLLPSALLETSKMLYNKPAAIREVSKFFGKEYSEDEIQKLSNHISIDNFKNNESINPSDMNTPEMVNMEAEGFIRKGGSGGWRKIFDEEMLEQAERWMQRHLSDTDLRFPQT